MNKRFDLIETISEQSTHLVVRACIGSCPMLSCGSVDVDIVLVLPGYYDVLRRKQ